jgi:hypothetical protein
MKYYNDTIKYLIFQFFINKYNMNDNKCYSEEFIKLLQNSYNEFCKVILKNSKNFYIIDMIECYRIYDSIFTYEQPYKQKYKLFIDNYGNTYGFEWNLWEKKIFIYF